MMFIPIVSVAAFIVILWDLDWKWVQLTDFQVVNFVHSIFGIVVIGLSFIQVNQIKMSDIN